MVLRGAESNHDDTNRNPRRRNGLAKTSEAGTRRAAQGSHESALRVHRIDRVGRVQRSTAEYRAVLDRMAGTLWREIIVCLTDVLYVIFF